MRISKSLAVFGACLFFGLCLYDLLWMNGHFNGWLLQRPYLMRSLFRIGVEYRIPVVISLVVAGIALRWGMWRLARNGRERTALLLGLLFLCVTLPIASIYGVVGGECIFLGACI